MDNTRKGFKLTPTDKDKRIEELEQQIEKMKVLEKIERCVSLIWDFQEIYGEEDIEDFCRNELHTYPQYNEILDYFKRIANLEKENKVLAQNLEDTEILNKAYEKRFDDLEKENAELRKVAEFQQSSNMSRHFENKKLKEGLVIGSTFNKALNLMNKNLEEERDKYRNMVFDKDDQLTEAKRLLASWISDKPYTKSELKDLIADTEQFLSEVEK